MYVCNKLLIFVLLTNKKDENMEQFNVNIPPGTDFNKPTLYRLEFNEKEQVFRFDNYSHEADTFGYATISEYCSEMEFQVLVSYLDIKGKENDKLTIEYLLKSISEMKKFIYKLAEWNLAIVPL